MSRKDVWKERAWRARCDMHLAAQCRTVEDMRKMLLTARMELEAYFVLEQNERDIETRNRYSDDLEEMDESGTLLAAGT